MQADLLKEVLSDLDLTSESVNIIVDGEEKLLRLSTSGINGLLDIEIRKESDIVNTFTSKKSVNARYPMAMYKHALKPLSIAEKVSLRVNNQDLLCVQYMVKFEDQTSFLEFLCVPEEVVED